MSAASNEPSDWTTGWRSSRDTSGPAVPPAGEYRVKPFEPVTTWVPLHVRAEQAAYAIRTISVTSLPELCQTPAYARAVESSSWLPLSDEEIESAVTQRTGRAAVLESVPYVAIIAEPLLHAQLDSAQLMAEQMAHLATLAEQPNVSLLVIEYEHLSSTPCTFTLLATASSEPDVAIEVGVSRHHLKEGLAAVSNHVGVFNHLQSLALDPATSHAAIADSAARFASLADGDGHWGH